MRNLFSYFFIFLFYGVSFAQPEMSQQLELLDKNEYDRFGSSVAIHKDKAIVRGRNNVYFYKFNSGFWNLVQIIEPDEPTIFAISTDMDHEFAVFGDRNANHNGLKNVGAAYVYRYDGNEWIDPIKLTANDPQEYFDFGIDVKIENDLIVAGAHHYDETGAVYVFRYVDCEWVQEAKLSPSDGLATDDFGWRVGLHDSKIIVGTANGLGAYIFENINNEWVETAILKKGNGFGVNVHIRGDQAFVASLEGNGGTVYSYKKQGSEWVEDYKINSPELYESAGFGSRIAASSTKLVIGARTDKNSGNGEKSGAAYVYDFEENQVPQFNYKLSDEAGSDYDRYGMRLDIWDENIIIAASDADSGGIGSTGLVYLYYNNDISESLVLDSTIVIQPNCDSSGQIIVEASGGLPPYLYSIDDGETFQSEFEFLDLDQGVFEVVLMDSNGCLYHDCVELFSAMGPEIIDFSVVASTCASATGYLSIIANGVSPIEYSLDGMAFQSDNEFDNITSGWHIVAVRDSSDCVVYQEFDLPAINDSELIIDDLIIESSACLGSSGSVTIIATGFEPLEFSFDGSNYQSQNEFVNLASGWHVISIADSMGCLTEIELEIESENNLELQILNMSSPDCGESNGEIELALEGQTGEIQLYINDLPFSMEYTLDNLSSGEYHILVEDESGCISEETILLESEDCSFYVPNVFSPNGDGMNDEFLILAGNEFNGYLESVRIFDRWGEMIFEKLNFMPNIDSWDGSFNGLKVQPNVYVVSIEYKTENGEFNRITKDLTLVE